jgi:hypothetical protein
MKLFSIVFAALLFTNAAYADHPGANVHDCSGVIKVAGVAQNAFSANTTLRGFQVENVNGTGIMCFSLTGPAALTSFQSYTQCAAGSFTLNPNASGLAAPSSYTTPASLSPNTPLSVIADTAGEIYSCQWW